ncbi:MAG: alpha/beta fold hydrolase [Clostridia bacterium]|nr:alpha/beta fold hydrolase [Clostridia bacterium]
MLFYKFVKNLYQKLIFKRCDDEGLAYYFSAKDFEGLQTEPFSFKGNSDQKLKGNFYYYDNPDENRIIVFDHGMGGGHLSYMKEIEMLASQGYKVFAYDHTGCMESEGESAGGFSQSLSDLDCCLKALKSDEKYHNKTFSVMGHSWGGFSTLNISAFHPDLSHIVVLSGFVSVDIIASKFGFLKKYITAIEKEKNPAYVSCNAVDSLNNTDAKVLLVYSDNDKMVNKEMNFDYLVSSLKDRKNTSFILESNKDHNPNYTADAVRYLSEYLSTLNTQKKKLKTPEQKKAFVEGFDWDRMTRQDEAVWQKIFDHLAE